MNAENERALIGRRLKASRARAKLSKEDAAAAADVPAAAIGVWERGSSMPCLIQFRDLTAAYGVSPYHVLFGRSMYGFSKEDVRELMEHAKHFSPSLRRRVELVVAYQVRVDQDQAIN